MRASAAHAFVADVADPVLDETDRHHLERVLRLRPGEVVTVADGAGRWRRCTWEPGGGLDPAGEVVAEGPPHPPVTVGFALVKGDHDWVVQKLTEAGVDRIAPFLAARSVVRWDGEKAARNAHRWRRVAREAAMQSRRAWLPVVEDVVPFAQAVAARAEEVALAEPGGAPVSLGRPAVLVGPEGGWAPAELGTGLPTVGLGPTVLRTETAALVTAALLCALRAGVVCPAERQSPPLRPH